MNPGKSAILLFVWISLLSCLSDVFGQNIVVEPVKLLTKGKNQFWQIKGRHDLPPGTVVVMRLLWQNQEIKGSRCFRVLNTSRFDYRFGPFRGRPLFGAYQFEIGFHKSLQPKNSRVTRQLSSFSRRFPFDYGSEFQHRQEYRNWYAFERELLQQLQSWQRELDSTTEKFLTPRWLPAAEASAQMRQYFQNLADRQKQLGPWSPPELLFFHSRKDMRDIETVFFLCRLLWQHQVARVAHHYGQKQAVATDWTLAQCRQRLADTLRSLRQRMPQPDASYLSDELAWYRKFLERLQKNWSEYRQTARQEIKALQECIAKYRESPLAKEYPRLLPTLRELNQTVFDWFLAYSNQIARSSGDSNASRQLYRKIGQQFVALDTIVVKERKKKRELWRQRHQLLVGGFAQLVSLQKEIFQMMEQAPSQPLAPEKIAEIRLKWLQKHREIRLQWQEWQQDSAMKQNFTRPIYAFAEALDCLRTLCNSAFAALRANKSEREKASIRSRRYLTVKALTNLRHLLKETQGQ